MKNLILIIAIFLLADNVSGQNQPFYYYQGEKIFLKERPDKILVKLSKEANKTRLLSLIQTDGVVQISSKEKTKETIGPFIVLESKSKNALPAIALTKYKNSPDVASALPMLEYKDGKLQGLTDEFILKLNPESSFEQLQNLVKEKGCTIIKENEFVQNQFLISVSKSSNLNSLQLANLFYETGLFEFSEPNFFRQNIAHSNDPLFGNQWPLKNTGQNGGNSGADIKIEQAWSISQGRSEVLIAVVDQGIQLTHPDLAANLLPGFDATGNGTNGGPFNMTGNDPQTADFHGTSCAGIIAAIKDNGIGVTGVAPDCKLLPVNTSVNGNLTTQALADGLEWSWNPSFGNADVISNSWGGGSPSTAITNAVNNAVTQGRGGLGSIVLFSSGNDNNSSVSYPANLPNVIAVGASSNKDGRASYSNYGSELDIVAPGGDKNIYSTDIVGSAGYSANDYTTSFDGTSAACPHAAGVAALILSVNRCLTGIEVKQILELSCDKAGGYCYGSNGSHPNGTWNNQMGHGRINAFKAVQYAFSSGINNFTNVGSPTDNSATSTYQMVMYTGCSGVAAATYFVQRHEVIKNVTYPYTQAPIIIGTSNGLSAASPNDGNYWMDAYNLTTTSATLRTYVYATYNVLGQNIGWVPTSPSNVKFDYAVLSSMQQDIYLQNQTVSSGSQTHNAMGQIVAGSNITTAVPYGDYVVTGDANVSLHAGNSITLGPGTIISPGPNGYFHAYVDPFFTCAQYPQGKAAPPSGGGQLETATQKIVANYIEDYQTTFQKTEELKNRKLQPNIYPIPFSDKLTIEYTIASSENVTISICSLNGQELIQLKNKSKHEQGSYKIEFNGINLSAGTYLLKINTDQKETSQKIIKIQ